METLISLEIPPGASSTSRECRRETTRERCLPMSAFRFDNKRNTSLLSTAWTLRRSRFLNAVTATDVASLGSFLFDRPEPNTRVRAANVAGTSTTISPAVTSC